MATVIYEIPNSVKEMFEQGENSYRIIDYSIQEMDNIQSMQYFLDCIGATTDNIETDDGTQVVITHPDFDHKLVIDSGGLGDFYSHGYDVTLYSETVGSACAQHRYIRNTLYKILNYKIMIEEIKMHSLSNSLNILRDECYQASFNSGWHTDIETGELKERNKGEMIALIHSEISEAMEGERKNLNDDHLPHRPMAEVELADAIIRIMDYCGRWGYDIGGAIIEKMAYNAKRADHKIENRVKNGGKKW